jgi:hypothetical protein
VHADPVIMRSAATFGSYPVAARRHARALPSLCRGPSALRGGLQWPLAGPASLTRRRQDLHRTDDLQAIRPFFIADQQAITTQVDGALRGELTLVLRDVPAGRCCPARARKEPAYVS